MSGVGCVRGWLCQGLAVSGVGCIRGGQELQCFTFGAPVFYLAVSRQEPRAPMFYLLPLRMAAGDLTVSGVGCVRGGLCQGLAVSGVGCVRDGQELQCFTF